MHQAKWGCSSSSGLKSLTLLKDTQLRSAASVTTAEATARGACKNRRVSTDDPIPGSQSIPLSDRPGRGVGVCAEHTIKLSPRCESVAQERQHGGETVARAQLFSLSRRARVIRNRNLPNLFAQPADLRRDLRTKMEAITVKHDPIQQATAERFVARCLIMDPASVK